MNGGVSSWSASCNTNAQICRTFLRLFAICFDTSRHHHSSLHEQHRSTSRLATLTTATVIGAYTTFKQSLVFLAVISFLCLLSVTAMIRSVSRAASRLASQPSALTSATNSARTTVLRTLVAARHASSLTPTSASPAPTNLRTLKRDISRIIDEDTSDLAAAPDQGLLDYVKEQGLRITQDKEGLIKMARTVGDYNITVQFMPEVDEDEMGADADEQKPEGEDGEEGKAEGEEDDESRLPSHQWEVDVTNTVAPQHNTIRLACLTSKQGQYSIEAITFDPQPTTATPQQQQLDLSTNVDDRKQLYFDELSEATQDKMFELLETLGVDDKLGQFVQHYAQVVRTQLYLDKLKMLKQFLQQ